ncbi:hypothetical protein ACR777_02570 [Sphingobacterium spiritivorum]|uniref:hypothetical protein n=1 Tax=Sphingobacterium spiritivorum TaxID=258 RepID=UPI003DA5B21A
MTESMHKRFEKIHEYLTTIEHVKAIQKPEYKLIIYYYHKFDFFLLDQEKNVLVFKDPLFDYKPGEFFFKEHLHNLHPYPYLNRGAWSAYNLGHSVPISEIFDLITLNKTYYIDLIANKS